jgi:outer membrane protein
MNKIKVLIVAAILTIGAVSANAQKIGYIRVDDVVALMPDVKNINEKLQKFQTDSLGAELTSLIQEYNFKDSILNKTDTSKIPVSVRKQHRQDLEQIAYQVQNWQSISQNVMQGKQEEMLAPLYQKAITAINTVAKEKGYSYVLTKEAFLVAPPGDDLLPSVAAKLNLKLPTAANQAPANPAAKKQ